MAAEVDLTLHENNDETVSFTITPTDSSDDLTAIDSLELYLKTNNCVADDDPTTLILTSGDSGEIDILTQTSSEITGEAFIPASALDFPYDRFWHLDAITNAGARRTAIYGDVQVVSL